MSKTPLKKRDKNRIRKRTDVFTYFQEVQVQMIPPPPQLIHWMQIARIRMTDAMLGSMEDTVKDSGDHIWKIIAKNLVNSDCQDKNEVCKFWANQRGNCRHAWMRANGKKILCIVLTLVNQTISRLKSINLVTYVQ